MSPLFLLLPILVPLLGGLILIRVSKAGRRIQNCCAMAVVCLTSLLVWIVLLRTGQESIQLYSFTRGFSIDLMADGPARMFALMISVMWPFVMLFAFDYMSGHEHTGQFFAFYVMTYGITLGVAFSANLTTLYVFYEMLSLVTIPLVSFYSDHESMYAARKYAAYTIGGASLGFISVVMTGIHNGGSNFLYGGNFTGSFNFNLMQIVFLFGFFGFGVKAAVFPLHDWLPTASAAPTPVTALLHAVAVVNSGVFAVIRLAWYIYGPQFLRGSRCLEIAQAFAIFTLVYAAVLAVKQRHFKRRLACSTISNLSYMLFGILLMTPAGLEAGLLHMLFHSVIKMTLFLCAGAFMHATGKSYVFEVNGIGRKMPLTFALYTLSALSLVGVPGLCGFVSKLHLVMAGLEEASTISVAGSAGLMIAAFLCAIYTLTISIRAFFPMEDKGLFDDKTVHEAHVLMLIPICFFSVVNVVLGLWPGLVTGLIGRIAQGLM